MWYQTIIWINAALYQWSSWEKRTWWDLNPDVIIFIKENISDVSKMPVIFFLRLPGDTGCVVNIFLCSVNSHEGFSASAFSGQSWKNYHSNETCVVLITHLLSIRANNILKMLINNKFKAQAPTGNLLCHVLESRALNLSCSLRGKQTNVSDVSVNSSSICLVWASTEIVSSSI